MKAKFCEATQQPEVTIEIEMLYCIHCGQMVKAEQNGEYHTNLAGEIETCNFPEGWAVCPPPVEAIEVGEDFFNGDWAEQSDPTAEEEEEIKGTAQMWEE